MGRGGGGEFAYTGRGRDSTGYERTGECLEKVYKDRRDWFGISHGRDPRVIKTDARTSLLQNEYQVSANPIYK